MYHGNYRDSRREVLCYKCLGDECDYCNDEGTIILPRNDNEYDFSPYYEHPDMPELFRAYVWLKKYNMLPDTGTWVNQSVRFIKTVEWCDLAASKWNQLQHERDKATAALTKQMGAMLP